MQITNVKTLHLIHKYLIEVKTRDAGFPNSTKNIPAKKFYSGTFVAQLVKFMHCPQKDPTWRRLSLLLVAKGLNFLFVVLPIYVTWKLLKL